MEKLQIDNKSQLSTPTSTATTPTSRPSSRRTSTIIPRDTLPTPPPDPRGGSQSDNIFIYPPIDKDLPAELQGLLRYAERQEEFEKALNKKIANDCRTLHHPKGEDSASSGQEDKHRCSCCEKIRKEYAEIMDPLQYRLNGTVTAALAAYGAIEQLNRLYSMWEQYITKERELRQRKECLRYVKLLERKSMDSTTAEKPQTTASAPLSDTEIDHQDMEQSIALLETILHPEQLARYKTHESKLQRERSKSFMLEDMSSMRGDRESSKSLVGVPHLLRRQSTYCDSKSKVSKWTKVKAAFKWEKANVPIMVESQKDGVLVGLTPNNTEVARYLRVPSAPCGNSSADSVLSSSSGHLLSETGTPGTISSASSMDDIDNSGGSLSNMRRDSSKSETLETHTERSMSQPIVQESKSADTLNVDDIKYSMPPKSSSNKSIRKCKLISDFEVVPEDVEAVIKTQTKRKNPPRPLDLNLRQDLNDSENYYMSSHLLKASPQEGTQSLNRALKKISSPVNSSVPSSPSRHSDFFAEFESEDLSSGDFSEPNSPNHHTSRQGFEAQQEEVNRRYQILRAKLGQEFESKRKEWEKLKSKRAMALVSAPKPPEPLSPNLTASLGSNFSAKLLEENLTPDFKKKLQKWRVKKQASIGGIHGAPVSPLSPKEGNASCSHVPKETKIDWNLWKTGQLKLEGQGLTPLPDQKDLPEDFQKKLEQWNKIKRGGSASNCTDSLKRQKHGGSGKKGESDDDRGGGASSADKEKRLDKHKHHEKEKSERLAKLKAIVSDHPAKEIEVKTSAGVMKFEGISRKFTRKLYEWEKARGIGPESSTFALLHPGYCPIDVKRISKETHNHENSPTLSRSLSLDSISPSIALPVISQQASSLSLNDVNDLKEMEGGVSSTDALTVDSDYNKKYDEPEAVMVEVEDDIVETACPLVMSSHAVARKQKPVYKYEEKTCKDFCNTRKVQSFESHTNLAPLLNVLKNSEELLKLLKTKSPEVAENTALRFCESTLALIRSSYSYYAANLMKPTVLNAISDVQNELSRLRILCEKSPLDEACCQEVMEERNLEYNEEFEGLHETLDILKQNIQGGLPRYSKDIVPDINIITDEGLNSSFVQSSDNRNDNLSTTLEATDELSTSMVENDTEGPTAFAAAAPPCTSVDVTATIVIRSVTANGNSNGSVGGGTASGAKKKVRLRKMGSRQNSKTESDSSDDDNLNILETPRRLKRKNYRLKQRSFDEDPSSATIAEETCENVLKNIAADTKLPRPSSLPLATSTSLPSVFVKTKRKVFTTVPEPTAIDGLAVIEQEILHSPTETADDKTSKHVVEPAKSDMVVVKPRRILQREDTLIPADSESLINNLINVLRPRILLVHKSISLEDIRPDLDFEDKRKSHSMESLKQADKYKNSKGPRAPLASDSFRKISRGLENPLRLANISKIQALLGTTKRKDHLFKKHSEKPFIPQANVNKGATIKKIENKLAKTHSSSYVNETGGSTSKFLSPDKFDNTMPRIARKWDRKSLTPTTQQIKFDFPSPNISEPTTPVFEQFSRPLTPLTERAMRLQRAKEEFLRAKPGHRVVVKLRDNVPKTENWLEKRQSDLSLSSTTADETSLQGLRLEHLESSELQKSLSADTIRAETPPTQSDTGTDQDFGGIYDSLPRQVTRSGKISSKLGFATLASKLRRVKGKKPKEPKRSVTSSIAGGGSALSALCRQSLMADVIAVPQLVAADEKGKPPKTPSPSENVLKSQSSPHAIYRGSAGSGDMGRMVANNERLNKSQSEQYVKRHKESYV